MARLLFHLGNVALVTPFPGQVRQAAQEKEGRTDRRANGSDLNINNRGSRLTVRFGDENVHL